MLFAQRLDMISMYILFSVFFSVLCTATAENEKIQFNVRNDCRCGRRSDYGFRIVGGSEAKRHTNPWMAALYSTQHEKVFCGGALINDRFVITAAHCLKKPKKESLRVVLGLHNTELLEDNEEGEQFEIEEIIMHENFSTVSFYDVDDIALLKLKQPVKYSLSVRPICLPKNPDKTYENKEAVVLGWGKTRYKVGSSSRLLREADLIVQSDEECKNNTVIGQYILDTMMCAYWESSDACQGDSGGPLTYLTNRGRVELIGLVSWGIECATPNVPGVYTRITSKLDWIAEKTKDAFYCRNI